MLWIDKYQPRHLNELSCHPEITNHLEQLTKKNNLPHMLFYGCSGAGKKTRIMAVLRAVFGDAIDKVGDSSNIIAIFSMLMNCRLKPKPSLRKVSMLNLLAVLHFIIIKVNSSIIKPSNDILLSILVSAAELGTKDRICVQYLIKQLASQRSAMTFTIPTNNIKAKYRG